jgi:hypothetical protein
MAAQWILRRSFLPSDAAQDAATGQVTDACYPRHRHQEFPRFLKKVAAACPGTDLHVICGNYATHKHPGSGPG